MANGRRVKLALIMLVLLASALALFAWTRVWIDATLLAGTPGSQTQQLEVQGASAAPALTALALSGVALAGALTIAGPLIRVILGILEVLLGGCVALSAFLVIADPAAASASSVTSVTGIAGEESVLGGIAGASLTAWPFVALAAGVIMALAGVGILATSGSWPRSTSRYQAVRLEPAQSGNAPTGDARSRSVDSWDELTRGTDPTN